MKSRVGVLWKMASPLFACSYGVVIGLFSEGEADFSAKCASGAGSWWKAWSDSWADSVFSSYLATYAWSSGTESTDSLISSLFSWRDLRAVWSFPYSERLVADVKGLIWHWTASLDFSNCDYPFPMSPRYLEAKAFETDSLCWMLTSESSAEESAGSTRLEGSATISVFGILLESSDSWKKSVASSRGPSGSWKGTSEPREH